MKYKKVFIMLIAVKVNDCIALFELTLLLSRYWRWFMKIENTVLMHYIVNYFNFPTRDQCLQCCIQISTLLSLTFLIQSASLIPKTVE
jgi:hypothetical protein